MTLSVFISAVSDELGDYREALRRALARPDLNPVVQDDFKAGGLPTLLKLDNFIQRCDAVVHLVGDGCGAEAPAVSARALAQRYPDLAARFPSLGAYMTGEELLPYTQWEAWLALYHDKPLLVARPAPDAARRAGYERAPVQAVRQLAHLQALARDCDIHAEIEFTTADSLGLQLMVSSLLDQFVATVVASKQAHQGPERLAHKTVLALAKQLEPDDWQDFDRAVEELKSAIGVALQVRAQGRHGAGHPSGFVDDVMRRVADLTAAGQLQQGADSIDDALADQDRRDAVQREASLRQRKQLLDASIRQGVLLRDADRVVKAVVTLSALEAPDQQASHDVLRARFNEFYSRGRDQGSRFHLLVAIALGRLRHAAAETPERKGDALTKLGNALFELGKRESGVLRLKEAMLIFQTALKAYGLRRAPKKWVMVHSNIGAVLRVLAEREGGTARLAEAVQTYRAALQGLEPDRTSLDWATVQNNLGTALGTWAEHEADTARLKESVQAFRAALDTRAREQAPRSWAAMQVNLGNALCALADHEPGSQRPQEAILAFRMALEVFTRDELPLDWATAQNNLGNVLLGLGQRDTGSEKLEEAIQHYRAALEERTRERTPPGWAATHINLGHALWALGEREGSLARLEEAGQAYRAALEVYTEDHWPVQFAAAGSYLAKVESMLAANGAASGVA